MTTPSAPGSGWLDPSGWICTTIGRAGSRRLRCTLVCFPLRPLPCAALRFEPQPQAAADGRPKQSKVRIKIGSARRSAVHAAVAAVVCSSDRAGVRDRYCFEAPLVQPSAARAVRRVRAGAGRPVGRRWAPLRWIQRHLGGIKRWTVAASQCCLDAWGRRMLGLHCTVHERDGVVGSGRGV